MSWKQPFKESVELYKIGRDEEALQKLNESIDSDLSQIVSRDTRSAVLLRLGRHRDALDDARACIKQEPQGFKGYYRAGVIFLQINKNENCLKMLDEADHFAGNDSQQRLITQLRGQFVDKWKPDVTVSLPSELLLLIFNFMANPTLASHVCSRWRELALGSPRLWRRLKLEKSGKKETAWLSRSEGIIHELIIPPKLKPSEDFPLRDLTRLELESIDEDSGKVFESLCVDDFPIWDKLKVLHVSYRKSIGQILYVPHRLEELSCRGFTMLDCLSIELSRPQLKVLNLSYGGASTNGLTRQAFRLLFLCPATMRSFKLSNPDWSDSLFENMGWQDLTPSSIINFPQLQILHLAQAPRVVIPVLHRICCSQLTSLQIGKTLPEFVSLFTKKVASLEWSTLQILSLVGMARNTNYEVLGKSLKILRQLRAVNFSRSSGACVLLQHLGHSNQLNTLNLTATDLRGPEIRDLVRSDTNRKWALTLDRNLLLDSEVIAWLRQVVGNAGGTVSCVYETAEEVRMRPRLRAESSRV